MIYSLMRFDPAWKATGWVTLLSVAAWSSPPASGRFGPLITLMALFGGLPHQRATRFQASVPVEARDLLWARTLSLLAVIWLPAMAGGVVAAIARGVTATIWQPVAMASLCTVAGALVQSVRLKEVSGPNWLVFPFFVLIPAAGPTVVDRPNLLVASLCATAGLGLFAWNLARVPHSFLLTGERVRARAAKPTGGSAAFPILPWAPVARSVFSWQYWFFTVMIALQAFGGQWLFAPFWMLIVWMTMRRRIRWLWALPVSRRVLLWTMIGPMLAALLLGYAVTFLGLRHVVAVRDPRVVVLSILFSLAWAMLTFLLCALADWRGLARVPYGIRTNLITGLLGFLIVFSLVMQVAAPHGSRWAQDAVERFGRSLTISVPTLAAAAAICLAALCVAVERVFGNSDFVDKPVPAQP